MAENDVSPKSDKLDDFDYWRLCEELTIIEAALLVTGFSPAKFPYVENWQPHERPQGYEAAKSAIRNALRAGRIKGEIEPEMDGDINGNQYPIQGTLSLSSRVAVESLKSWLSDQGFRRGFFFPKKVETADYLDTSNPRFAPKLAAAVRAWQAVTESGWRSPKQALMKWIREHAAEFGLTDDDGKPNESAIEDIAKVANWQMTGGAPKTPSGQEPTQD